MIVRLLIACAAFLGILLLAAFAGAAGAYLGYLFTGIV